MSIVSRIVSICRRPVASLLGVVVALAVAGAVPGCSDGEGTLFTINSVPSANGGPSMLVYQTRAIGWDDAAQRSFTAYVEVYGEQSDEFLPRGVLNVGVFMRVFSFDGPAWPAADMEIRSDGHPTILLASADFLETGMDQIEVPGGGGVKQAQYFACGVDGGTLMRVSARQSLRLKGGPVEVELTFDQLQGIAKYLNRIMQPPQ